MRIALFTETFVPKIDGIVTTLCETTRQLTRMGHEVLVVAPDCGVSTFEDARVESVKGLRFPLYPELKLAIPRASLRDKVLDFAPDLIHVADPVLLGIAGLYFSGGTHGGALGLPLVVSYHTDLPSYLHYYGMGILERYIWSIMRARHNRATVNLATSLPILEQLRANGIERVELWPGGVDTARFQAGRRSDEMRRRLSGGEPGKPLLLYVGRLSAEKDLERFRPILEALPGARLALVGDGPHHKTIEKHLAGLPVVLAGFLRGDELAAAYASADIFVMPSRTETLGLVVLEAMASGLPVVAARAGGIPDLIRDGVSGCLFDEEPQAVAAIRDFLESPERRASFGAAARASAAQQSWSRATEILLEHYRSAQATQRIVPSGDREPLRAGFGLRTRMMAQRSGRWALRRLFP
jgi:glycosyltransferase involved in cell wall biosynthesis